MHGTRLWPGFGSAASARPARPGRHVRTTRIACPDCGTVQRVPVLQRRGKLECCRCGNTLERATGRSLDAALAMSLATLIVLFPANLMTLMSLTILGMDRSSVLGSGVIGMWQEGYLLLAIGVGLQGIVLPFFRFGMLATVLASIRFDFQGPWTGRVFRWADVLDLWAMPDVFLIGGAIGYSRVAAFLPVTIGPGGWALVAAAMFSMLTRASLDKRSIWRMILAPEAPEGHAVLGCTTCDLVVPVRLEGQNCPRCAARLRRRRPASVMAALPLVVAGYLLFPVANYFPMSVQYRPGGRENLHTIASGVEQLFGAGLWPLGILIFCTSIAIPLLKLVGLSWMMWSVHHGSDRRLVLKTRLYRAIEELGRWSNIDVFTVAIFLPLIQVGGFVSVQAGTGAPAFLGVVVLTMIASRIFDPRLMWDSARGHA